MKKFRLLALPVLSLMVVFLFSCGGGSSTKSGDESAKVSRGSKSDTPKSITETLWKKIQKGQYEEAVNYMADKMEYPEGTTQAELDQWKLFLTGIMEMRKKDDLANGGIKKVEITDEKINDDGTATVEVLITYSNGKTEDQDAHFEKNKNGIWKAGFAK